MTNLHQKKFYSSEEVDAVVEGHKVKLRARNPERNRPVGYSESLRDIVEQFGEIEIQIAGIIKDSKIEWRR